MIGLLLAMMLLAVGCQHAAVSTGDYTGQGLLVTHQTATPVTVIATHKDGAVETGATIPAPAPDNPVVKVVIVPPQPAKSTYTITPEKQDGDNYAGLRVMSWATKSPNMVAGEVFSQRKGKETKPMPAIKVDENGINASVGGGSTSQDTGISWVTRVKNWFAQVWSWLTMTGFWLVVLLVGVFVIMPIVLPSTAPIVRSIWQTMVRWVTGVWNWIVGRFTKVRAEKAVVGGRRATDAVTENTEPTVTPPTK